MKTARPLPDLFRALPLILAAIVPAAAAHAQEAIVVTGTALPPAPGAAAYGSFTLGRDLLTNEASGQLENALEAIPGFQLFRRSDARSANATSQGATLRGIGGNATGRALVLLDGVPVADPFAGYIPWPAIAPESLALVRATPGGGAGPFGAGALSGTIDLVSAGPAARDSGIGARYGSRDSVDIGVALVEPLGGGFVALDAAYASGDGFFVIAPEDRGAVDTRSPYDQQNVAVRAVFPVAADTELQARGAWFADDRRRGQRLVTSGMDGADASLRLVRRGRLPFEALAYVQARGFRSTFARTAPDRSTEQPALDQYNVPATGLGAKLEVRPTLGAHALRLGVDWRHAEGETNERFDFEDGRLTALRSAGGRSDTVGLFVEDDWRVAETFLLTAGARLDRWWLTDGRFTERGQVERFKDRSGWEPTARIGAAYDATPALTLRGAAYLGWRLPTLNELYRPFRVGPDATAANPALEPERSRGVEVGADFQPLSTVRLGVTLYALRAENIVSNITLAQGPGVFPGVGFVFGSFRQRLNLDAVESVGVEARGALRIGRFDLAAGYAFTDAEQRGSGPAAPQDGLRPPQVPRHSAQASLRTRLPLGVEAGAKLRYGGTQFEGDLEQRPLEDFIQLDADAAIPLDERLTLTLAGENLTDARIEDGIDVRGATTLAAPRTFWIGLRWND